MSGVLGDRTTRLNHTKDSRHHHDIQGALWEAVRELKKIVNREEMRGKKSTHVSREETEAVALVRKLVKQGASIDRSQVLHRAVANCFERRQIEYLVKLGGSVNLREPRFGGTPLHLAASNHTDAIPWLMELGADKRAKDNMGRTPLFLLQKKWKEFEDDCRQDALVIAPEWCKEYLNNTLMLATSSQKQHLSSGWLSPRMAHRLLRSAELEGDAISDGVGNLSYIPDTLWRKSGQTSAFLLGYQGCYVAAAHYLRQGKAPTVDLIRSSSSPAIRCIRGYLARGGKIEYALDAIIDLASRCEEDDLEYDTEYSKLPMTKLDDAFEVAKAMCIDFGGGKLEEKGPYVIRYQDEESVDEYDGGLGYPPRRHPDQPDEYYPSDEEVHVDENEGWLSN